MLSMRVDPLSFYSAKDVGGVTIYDLSNATRPRPRHTRGASLLSLTSLVVLFRETPYAVAF